jgi:hypothetical protein
MTENANEAIRNEIAKWEEVKARYGNFEYIDNPSEVIGIDKKRIWTEFWVQNQVIENVYTEVKEFDGTISAYYVFERPYEEPESTITLITTIWDDCECSGQDDECSECEGSGTIATDLI